MFLTISEALKLLNNNKSYSALNRLVHKLKNDKSTKHHIRNVKGKNLISKKYLEDNFSDLITVVVSDDNLVNHSPETLTSIEILQNQLSIKDKLINDLSRKLDIKEEKERELTATIIKLSNDITAIKADNNSDEKTVKKRLIIAEKEKYKKKKKQLKEKEEKLNKVLSDIDSSTFREKLRFLFGKRDKPYHDDLLK